MACPHVAGIAALYLESEAMTPNQVVSTMQCSAIPGLLDEVEYGYSFSFSYYGTWEDDEPRFLAQVPLESFSVSDEFDPEGCETMAPSISAVPTVSAPPTIQPVPVPTSAPTHSLQPTPQPTPEPLFEIAGSLTVGTEVYGDTTSASDVYGNPSNENFYLFTPLEDGEFTFSTCGSKYDTYLRFFETDGSGEYKPSTTAEIGNGYDDDGSEYCTYDDDGEYAYSGDVSTQYHYGGNECASCCLTVSTRYSSF